MSPDWRDARQGETPPQLHRPPGDYCRPARRPCELAVGAARMLARAIRQALRQNSWQNHTRKPVFFNAYRQRARAATVSKTASSLHWRAVTVYWRCMLESFGKVAIFEQEDSESGRESLPFRQTWQAAIFQTLTSPRLFNERNGGEVQLSIEFLAGSHFTSAICSLQSSLTTVPRPDRSGIWMVDRSTPTVYLLCRNI